MIPRTKPRFPSSDELRWCLAGMKRELRYLYGTIREEKTHPVMFHRDMRRYEELRTTISCLDDYAEAYNRDLSQEGLDQ